MIVRRIAARLHFWLAAAIGLQLLAWLAGGLLMSALPIEQVRGEHKIRKQEAVLLDPAGLMPLNETMRTHRMDGLVRAELIEVAEVPVWRIEDRNGPHLMDARSGTVLSPIGEALALRIAAGDYAGPGQVSHAVLLDEPPTEYGGPGPVWRVTYDDADRTALYISPFSGAVEARRGRTWRVFDTAWRLHVMDYDDGADFNHPLLIGAAGAAVLFAISGFVLFTIRARQAIARRRAVAMSIV